MQVLAGQFFVQDHVTRDGEKSGNCSDGLSVDYFLFIFHIPFESVATFQGLTR